MSRRLCVAANKSYISSFLLSIALTAIPFALVMKGMLSQQATLIAIFCVAVMQILIHLYYFLHLDDSTKARWGVLSLLFARLIMALIVGGTIWIMYNLNYRMIWRSKGMLMNYWRVTKPGIVFGNLVSVMGGFFLAARGHVDFSLLLSTTIGICLVIASACVLNNCLDRDMDQMMSRTRERVLARRLMSPKTAALYASVLGIGGLTLLMCEDNLLTIAIVMTGFVIYVGVYSPLKRHSVYAPLIGSLAGAAPPLAGYCAVNNSFDMGAVILLLIFSLWQIPHFYAITIFRLDDYVSAAIPILPVRQGLPATRKHIIGFISIFIVVTMLLTFYGYTGYGYLVVTTTLGLIWLSVAYKGYKNTSIKRWGRRMFICSILTIFMLSIMMSIDFSTPASLEFAHSSAK